MARAILVFSKLQHSALRSATNIRANKKRVYSWTIYIILVLKNVHKDECTAVQDKLGLRYTPAVFF